MAKSKGVVGAIGPDSGKKQRKAAKRLAKQIAKAEKKKGHKQGDAPAFYEVGLDLNALRIANVARCKDPKGFDHPLNAWSIAEWGNALAGECGEACNVAKKLLRVRKKTRGNVKKGDKTERNLLKKFAYEIAGVVCYADLVLASEGISLSQAIINEFNKKSDEIGYDFKL